MNGSIRRTTRLVLALSLLALGVAAGPGPAWAEDRPAPAFGIAALGGEAGRPAPAYGIAAQDRGIDPGGSIGRPAPAYGVAAQTPEAAPTPVATVPADGFDFRDAIIGAAISLGIVLFLIGAARAARGLGRFAHR